MPDTATVLRRLDARAERLHTFRPLAGMQYESPQERVHVREVIVLERPDRLRIEMISAFGVALQITSDGKRLRAYHRGEKAFYTGEATAENLARFTRLPLEIREIVNLLLGIPPHRKAAGRPREALEMPTRLWRVTLPLSDGGLQIIWFDLEHELPVRAEEVDANGDRRYLTAYEDYRAIGGVLVPHGVEVMIPDRDATVTLRYSDVSVNQAVPPDLFSFPPPEGAKVIDLDHLDGTG